MDERVLESQPLPLPRPVGSAAASLPFGCPLTPSWAFFPPKTGSRAGPFPQVSLPYCISQRNDTPFTALLGEKDRGKSWPSIPDVIIAGMCRELTRIRQHTNFCTYHLVYFPTNLRMKYHCRRILQYRTKPQRACITVQIPEPHAMARTQLST